MENAEERGNAINPKWFELHSSRAIESEDLTVFMRATVLVLDVLVWWTAVIAWMIHEGGKGSRSWRTQVRLVARNLSCYREAESDDWDHDRLASTVIDLDRQWPFSVSCCIWLDVLR